jgi:hypothetical protein
MQPPLGQTAPFASRRERIVGQTAASFCWSEGAPRLERAACESVGSIAPVDLKVPDWLVEALRREGPRVGEPDSLSAAEVVHPG